METHFFDERDDRTSRVPTPSSAIPPTSPRRSSWRSPSRPGVELRELVVTGPLETSWP
jgi:hypothetical protein